MIQAKDTSYDEYIEAHRARVNELLMAISSELLIRGDEHDLSKLTNQDEYAMFSGIHDRIKTIEFGSDDYQKILDDMGETLQIHYKNNRHHPEHFLSGVSGMNLIDVIEMLCDWVAASESKGQGSPSLEYLKKRFNLSDQLSQILYNTIVDLKHNRI